MSDLPDFEPEPMGVGLVVGLCLSALIVLAGLGVSLWSPATVGQWSDVESSELRGGIKFPPLEIDRARLAQARSEHYELPDVEYVDDEIEELRRTYQLVNLSDFPSTDDLSDLSDAELRYKARFLAGDIVGATGVRGFQPLGQPHFEACLEGLEELLSAIQAGDLSMERALRDPPQQRFSRYRQHCGNLLAELRRRHLVNSDGQWEHDYGPELAELMRRYMWADLIANLYPMHQIMSRYELEVFFRWRIEDDQAFPPRRRRELLSRAQNRYLPEDYDFPLAWARLDVANFDMAGALDRFAELVDDHPDNELYRAIYEDLLQQVGAPR